MLKIKVCGITNIPDAEATAEEGADFIGLIFAKSPRRVDLATAKQIISTLPSTTVPVGVFRDQPFQEVREIVAATGLQFAQLHGAESPDFAASLGVNVFKSFDCYSDETLETLRRYDTYAFLLDVPKGITARRSVDAHWALCAKKFGRVILSGGLTANTVGEIIRKIRPFGVDVCRATETEPGKKDRSKVRDFILAAQVAEQESATVRVKVKVR